MARRESWTGMPENGKDKGGRPGYFLNDMVVIPQVEVKNRQHDFKGAEMNQGRRS